MESTIVTAVSGMGVTGTGFFFLWIFMQRYFKQMDTIYAKQMDTIAAQLCNFVTEMRVLVSKIEALQTTQVAHQEIDRAYSEKIGSMNNGIGEIHRSVAELLNETRKIPFGKIAISKGYLSRDQVDEILREQTDLHKRY